MPLPFQVEWVTLPNGRRAARVRIETADGVGEGTAALDPMIDPSMIPARVSGCPEAGNVWKWLRRAACNVAGAFGDAFNWVRGVVSWVAGALETALGVVDGALQWLQEQEALLIAFEVASAAAGFPGASQLIFAQLNIAGDVLFTATSMLQVSEVLEAAGMTEEARELAEQAYAAIAERVGEANADIVYGDAVVLQQELAQTAPLVREPRDPEELARNAAEAVERMAARGAVEGIPVGTREQPLELMQRLQRLLGVGVTGYYNWQTQQAAERVLGRSIAPPFTARRLVGPMEIHWSARMAAQAVDQMAAQALEDEQPLGSPSDPVPVIQEIQAALGVPQTGYYDEATRQAASRELGKQVAMPVLAPELAADQLYDFIAWAWQQDPDALMDPPDHVRDVLARAQRWMGHPSPSGRYDLWTLEHGSRLSGRQFPGGAVLTAEHEQNTAHAMADLITRTAQASGVEALYDADNPHVARMMVQVQAHYDLPETGVYDVTTQRHLEALTGRQMPPGVSMGIDADHAFNAMLQAARRRLLRSDRPGTVTLSGLDDAAEQGRAFPAGTITPEAYAYAAARGRVFWETGAA